MRVPDARGGARTVLALFTAALLWGCGGGGGSSTTTPDDNPGDPGAQPTNTRTVTGFVGDATTGLGISGAAVAIGSLSATAATTGQFTVARVPRLDYSVTITATGYKARLFTLASNVDAITVRLVPVGAPTVEDPPDPTGL